MSEKAWEAIGAIAGVLALMLSIALEWKRIKELFASARASSIGRIDVFIHAIIVVAIRAMRPLLVILAIMLLGIWIRSNLLVQPLHPLMSWTFWQYALAIAQVVPLALLVYILVIEPWRRTRRAEKARDLLAKSWREAIDQIPVVPIVFYEDTFPCSWVHSPEQATSYFEEHRFLRANAQELKDMMERAIEHRTAHKTVFVFIHDIVPMSITQVRDPTCTIRRYLDAGGRVVWWGDIPLHRRGLPGRAMMEQWMGGPAILSVDHYNPVHVKTRDPVMWNRSDLDGNIQLTDAGRAIGMTVAGQCVRPARVDQNTIVYSEIVGDLGFEEPSKSLRWAISWRKVFNAHYPHSGFMQYLSGEVDCNEKSVVEDFFRFSVSDWPFAFTT
ncbi:MAG: hypothetical protein ACETWR_00300 [Anaerolineae bacterium]